GLDALRAPDCSRPAESSQEPAEHPDPASEATTPPLPATALSATPEPPPAADAATRAHATTEHARSPDRAAPTVSATSGHPLPPEPPAGPTPDRVGHGAAGRRWVRYRWPALAGLVVAVGAIAAIIALSSGSSPTGAGRQNMA